MDETVVLILLAVVMLVGSFLAGSIPLVVNLSEVSCVSVDTSYDFIIIIFCRRNCSWFRY